jgi:hypothetical protein
VAPLSSSVALPNFKKKFLNLILALEMVGCKYASKFQCTKG